jgi:alanine racemase
MTKAYIEINKNNLKENYNKIVDYIDDSKVKKLCVIKANGYGLGAVETAKIFAEEGADYFAVATLSEAVELRKNNISNPIMILGYTASEDFDIIIKYNITQTVYDVEQARCLNGCARKHNKIVNVHIKIETGLGRLGFFPEDESIDKIKEIKSLENLLVEGIYTHFACADNKDNNYTKAQFEHFSKFLKKLDLENINFSIRHAANSGAILNFKDTYLDMVRIGIILYGVYPVEDNTLSLKLKKTFSIKGKIASVKYLPEGYPIGYGGSYVTSKETKVAVIPMGYVDGIPKIYEKQGSILVGGKRCKILGGICMDQFMVDVSEVEDAEIGDEFVVIGRQSHEEITLDNLVEKSYTNCYETISRLGSRIKRIYI